jgi:hypothetical protein
VGQEIGQDRAGPIIKVLASRSSSSLGICLGRTDGSGTALAVGVYGRLWDRREPEVTGRASGGAAAARWMWFLKETTSLAAPSALTQASLCSA